MRVVLNGLITLKPKTGVGHYTAELFNALLMLADVECSMYPGALNWSPSFSPSSKTAKQNKDGPKPGLQRKRLKAFAEKLALTALPWHFAAYTHAFRFDLYHEPNFVPFRSHLPTVVTVHDLSVVRFPQWHPAYRVANHEKAFLPGLQRAAHILTDTEAVRQEVIAHLGIPAGKVTAVPIGIGPQFRPQSQATVAELRRKHELPDRFFLAVGTVEPRKNLLTVMRAFTDLPAEVRTSCPLVLAGPWGWRSEAEREFFDSHGQAAGIRHLGYISDAELPVLYAAARVLVYPSHYEGFGLPPLEMLAGGGAVLASTDPALSEVLAGHGERIDAHDSDGWRKAMLVAANDEEYLRGLRAGGFEHARQFTWERCAAGTAEVYRRVLSHH